MHLLCDLGQLDVQELRGRKEEAKATYFILIAPLCPNPWHFKSIITAAEWKVFPWDFSRFPWAGGARRAESHHALLLAVSAVSQPAAALPHHFVKVKAPADILRGFPELTLPWSKSEQFKAWQQGPKSSSLLHGHGFATYHSSCSPLAFGAILKML